MNPPSFSELSYGESEDGEEACLFDLINKNSVGDEAKASAARMLMRAREEDCFFEPSFDFNKLKSCFMKANIHPKYYPHAQVKCACGNTFTVGSTKEFIEVEICSKCHPFYTGKEKILDNVGRVEKFRKRLAKKEELRKIKKGKGKG